MIKRWLAQLLLNQVANVIERAAASDVYEKYQYLCPAIGHNSVNPFKRMALKLIEDNLRHGYTLYCTICRALREEGYTPKDASWYQHIEWSERIVIHRAYWAKVVSEMRKGNPTWGKYFNTKEIQADPPHLRDSYKSDEVVK